MYKEIDLSHFPPEREEKLKSIYRYSFFDTFMYRSNLWQHNFRVLWLFEEIAPIVQKHFPHFDVEKARAYALVHDDTEMVTGDIQSIVKSRMTPQELHELEESERKAMADLVKRSPEKVNNYSYAELLKHSVTKDCIEARVVTYVDKLDAFCEALHEIYAGNISLIRAIVFYSIQIPKLIIKYPDLKPLLDSKESSLFDISDQISLYKIEAKKYTELGKPHTKETLQINNDFPFYKTWKEVVIKHGKEDWLLEQREVLLNSTVSDFTS